MARRRPGFMAFAGFVGLLIVVGAGGYFLWTKVESGKEPGEAVDDGVNVSELGKDALEAMKAVFPQADPATGVALSNDPEIEKDGIHPGVATIRPVLTAGTKDRPVLIALTSEEDACHACAGSLSVYYLKRTGGVLALEQAFPRFLGGDGFGGAGKVQRIKLKGGKEAFSYTTGFSGQGYNCSSIDVFTLGAEAPVKALEHEPIFYSDADTGAADAGVVIEGKLAKAPKAHDLEIVFPAAKGWAAETAGFDFDGDVLKLASGRSLDKTC